MTKESPMHLLSEVPVWEAELSTWIAEKDLLEKRIAARQRLLAALRAEAELGPANLFDHTPAVSMPDETKNGQLSHDPAQPRTADAILTVLSESESPLTAREIFAELEHRGWVPLEARNPLNSVRTALWHLGKRERIARLGSSPVDRRWAAKTSLLTTDENRGGEEVG